MTREYVYVKVAALLPTAREGGPLKPPPDHHLYKSYFLALVDALDPVHEMVQERKLANERWQKKAKVMVKAIAGPLRNKFMFRFLVLAWAYKNYPEKCVDIS